MGRPRVDTSRRSETLRRRLQNPDQRVQALIEQLPAVVYLDVLDGSSLYVSPQVESMLGVTRQAWMDGLEGWLAAVHPDDRERVQSSFRQPRASVTSEEYRVVLPDGKVRWVNDVSSPVIGEGGRVELWYGVIVDVTERVALERALRRSEDHRRAVMASLVRREDEQRRQIAGELHDDTIQVMAATMIVLDQLRGALDRDEVDAARRFLGRAQEALVAATDRARRLTFSLRPQVLEARGLAEAVRVLVSELSEAGVGVSVQVDLDRHPHEVETLVYRTVAEAISNVRRHAQATSIKVGLRECRGVICGVVSDDGVGFESVDGSWRGTLSLHFGLQEAAERLEMAGGELRIDSAPGKGTRFCFRLPVDGLGARAAPRGEAADSEDV
jgi:PAS domain S-box-containing protein